MSNFSQIAMVKMSQFNSASVFKSDLNIQISSVSFLKWLILLIV